MAPTDAAGAPDAGERADVLIIGGGTAGCVVAARLSEAPDLRVVLVEAGEDHDAADRPDLTETYGGRAFMEPRYFWPGLVAQHASARRNEVAAVPYRQARLLGGGSSINGQIALRGAPADYDAWRDAGATGWGWDDVAPTFRAIERDLDFGAPPDHGRDGPVAIRRCPEPEWDAATRGFMQAWEALGSRYLPDLNGAFADGHGPLPFSNDGARRCSTSRAYLTPSVRARPNLRILTRAQALRILLAEGRATSAVVERDGFATTISARMVVVCAGALRSPHLLMLSGVGDGAALRRQGIAVAVHRPGVGANLQDHPIVSVAAYTQPRARRALPARAVMAYRRYSSGLAGCEPSDMVMSAGARTAWHALGARICALRCYIALPYSRGSVTVAGPDPRSQPSVDFNGMSDERDRLRMIGGFRDIAAICLQRLFPHTVSDVFPARLSQRVEALSRPTLRNDLLARLGAVVLDAAPRLRSRLLREMIGDGADLQGILSDESATERHVRANLGTSWHPCGTCRMGARDDVTAVVAPDGSVIGVEGLFVVDASIMPRIPRTNTNLPTVMLAERLAVRLRG